MNLTLHKMMTKHRRELGTQLELITVINNVKNLHEIKFYVKLPTSNSSKVDNDFHRLGSEIDFCKASSAATYISDSLIGRPIELSKFPGDELVRDMDIAGTLDEGDILKSEPELSASTQLD